MSLARDKMKSLLIFVTLFVCIFIFFFQRSNQQDSSIKTDLLTKIINTLNPAEKTNLKKHFTFELNIWKDDVTCQCQGSNNCYGGAGLGCEHCNQNHYLWDCVGEDRDWSVVFVDQRYISKKIVNWGSIVNFPRHDQNSLPL